MNRAVNIRQKARVWRASTHLQVLLCVILLGECASHFRRCSWWGQKAGHKVWLSQGHRSPAQHFKSLKLRCWDSLLWKAARCRKTGLWSSELSINSLWGASYDIEHWKRCCKLKIVVLGFTRTWVLGPSFAGTHSECSIPKQRGTMSTQLVWQLINKHNSFKVKNRTGKRTILSSEPGNLYNKHSYKHSGETW